LLTLIQHITQQDASNKTIIWVALRSSGKNLSMCLTAFTDIKHHPHSIFFFFVVYLTPPPLKLNAYLPAEKDLK
jgi:hypothetical protein